MITRNRRPRTRAILIVFSILFLGSMLFVLGDRFFPTDGAGATDEPHAETTVQPMPSTSHPGSQNQKPEESEPSKPADHDTTNEDEDADQTHENSNSSDEDAQNEDESTSDEPDADSQEADREPIDYTLIQPNEAGKIMIVMFHHFIETYTSGDKEWTITFDAFEELLHTLYEKGYSLISLTDYINGDIRTPAGRIPMVFTFDDGLSSQFALIEQDDDLILNPNTAVAIMKRFHEQYPDFGLEGSFFVNMGNLVFNGAGTVSERLRQLYAMGFEIENHSLTHMNLSNANTAEQIMREIGLNAAKIEQAIPGYTVRHFSLPFGVYPKEEFTHTLYEGEYDGHAYKNHTVLKVGWDPAPSPYHKDFDPLALPRVRAPGIEPVFGDLHWWLSQLSRIEQYISSGDFDHVVVPESQAFVLQERLAGNRTPVIYSPEPENGGSHD